MKRVSFALLAACAVLGTARAAEETVIKSSIVSVGLFKNGLAVVRREARLPGPGTYVIEDAPEPVHGTWWVECDAPVEARTTMREVTEPVRAGVGLDFQKVLVGRTVTIHFSDGQVPAATGKVEALVDPEREVSWSRSYQQPQHYWWNSYYGERGNAPPPTAPTCRFLILQTDQGRIFVDSNRIALLKAEGKEELTAQRHEAVLLLTAGKELAKPASARITYLAKGLSWAPSYRVDIGDPKTLTIEQAAVIKNELADIENAELQLISGFPSMSFAHVVSPLSPRTNWTSFFQQLNQGHPSTGNVVTQQRAMDNKPGPLGLNLGATPAGEGVDLHYQSLGARTLKEGDSLALSVARGQVDYTRIVEWLIPDLRDEYGRYADDWRRQQDPERYDDAAWDAVRFRNPFRFPMTTAPAMVTAGARYCGQQMSFWVNAGEETSVRVTKALSIRTRHSEREEPGERDVVYLGGKALRKTMVKGELAVNNHRKEDVTLVIRRRFSGELLSADGEPKKTLREEGAYAVNARYELTWTVVLKPGEEKALAYRYSLLVYH